MSSIHEGGVVSYIDSNFTDNWATGNGGTMYGGPHTVVGCRFIGNQAIDHSGGVAQLDAAPSTFTRCYYENNSAWAGALFSFQSTSASLIITDATAVDNFLTPYDGAYYSGEIVSNVVAGTVQASGIEIIHTAPCSEPPTYALFNLDSSQDVAILSQSYRGVTFATTGDNCPAVNGTAALARAVVTNPTFVHYTCQSRTFLSLETSAQASVCSTGAACVDASYPNIFPISCVCPGESYPYPEDRSGFKGSVAPYTHGCLTSRKAAALAAVSDYLIFTLRKTPMTNVQQAQNLTLRMTGTDESDATWTATDLGAASWLALPSVEGAIDSSDELQEVKLLLLASTAGWREQAGAYETTVRVVVVAMETRTFEVPVSMFVAADVDATRSVWGSASDGSSCTEAVAAARMSGVRRGDVTRIPFTACDVDALPVQHQQPTSTDARRFSAVLTSVATGEVISTQAIEYVGDGLYVVLMQADQIGDAHLSLSLDDEPVASTVNVSVVCPLGLEEMSDRVSCGCPAGSYGDGSGQCQPCSPGFTSMRGALGGCDACPAGTTSAPPGYVCEACSAGSYASQPGEEACSPCAEHTYSTEGATGCLACGKRNEILGTPNPGMQCPDGVLNGTKAGFWATPQLIIEANASSTATFACENVEVCLGGLTSECRAGHVSPLCSECAEGFYKEADKLCSSCGDNAGDGGDGALGLMWAVSFLCGLAVGLTLMLLLYKGFGTFIWEKFGWVWFGMVRFLMERSAEKAAQKRAKRAKRDKEAAKAAAERKAAEGPAAAPAPPPPPDRPPPSAPHGAAVKFATGAVIKFVTVDLVGFIQINSSFTDSMPEIPWPSSFAALSNSMRRAFNVGMATELGSIECWARANYCARTLNIFLAVSGFVAALPLFLFALRLCGVGEQKGRAVFDQATKFWMVILMFSYPPLNNFLMSTLLCQSFGDGVKTLRADRSIGCASEPQCLGTAAVFVPLFTVGFPVVLLLWMTQGFTDAGRKKLREAADDELAYEAEIARHKARFGFFTGKYETFYWCHARPAVAPPPDCATPTDVPPSRAGGTRCSRCSASCSSHRSEVCSPRATSPSRSCSSRSQSRLPSSSSLCGTRRLRRTRWTSSSSQRRRARCSR